MESELNLKIHQVEPLQPSTVSAYRMIAFYANHAPGLGALLYAIERDGRDIFYGTDTTILFEETWQAFHQDKMRFDLVVLDHTYGPEQPGSDNHLNTHQVSEHTKRLREGGILKDNGRVFATHIAHEGNPVHAELVEFASQHGYEIAYDSLRITV